MKEFIANKEKENSEKQNIKPSNKFQKSIENWKISNTEDKIESENRKLQRFLNQSVKTKETNEALMLHPEAAATQVGQQSFQGTGKE